MRRFNGKTALVTGAAHGIGRACALRLAREGANVAVADIDTEAASAVADEITSQEGTAEAVTCDVTDSDSIDTAVSRAVKVFGQLDVLVNNVGIAGSTKFADIDYEEWTRQTDPTLWGAMRCIQACLPHLRQRPDGGAVVSISSVNGMTAIGGIAYSAAKAGLINANSNLAVEYGAATLRRSDQQAAGVRFNVVAPGTVRTRVWDDQDEAMDRLSRFYPAGRVGEPGDIAAAVAFLASDDAAWITGATLPVDGGFTTGPLHAVNQLKNPQ